MNDDSIVGVVLAAGAGRRFAGPKQLAEFRGRPLIEWPISALTQAGLVRPIVVLGAYADDIQREADLEGAHIVRCPSWSEGQAASLATALRAAATRAASAVVIVLGDQPLLSAAAVRSLASASVPVAIAGYGGQSGHPVRLSASHWPQVIAGQGDVGARKLVGELGEVIDCTGMGSPEDVDTPEDLARLGGLPTEASSEGQGRSEGA